MTDPLLNYQTPPRQASSGWCTAAWIASLILGIFYCLGGLLVGLGAGLGMMVAFQMAGAPRRDFGIVLAVVGAILLYILGTGVLFILGAFRVRRGSRGWAIALLVMAALYGLVIFILVAIVAVAVLISGRDPAAFIGILFYLIPAAANVATALLLTMMLREERRAMRSLRERLTSPQPPNPP